MNRLEEIIRIDRSFFERYQKHILAVANTRPGRWFFGFDSKGRKLTKIMPAFVEYVREDGRTVGAFKTSNKYANRIKHSLRHFKALLLALGLGALAKGEQALALKFLFAGTVTSFRPDADPESTTVDGYAQHGGASSSWASLRGAAGNFSEDNSDDYLYAQWVATAVLNQWDTIARGIFLFDTSAILSSATISAATFTFYCTLKTTPLDTDVTKRELRLVASLPATNTAIVSGDFATLGTTSFGSIAFGSTTAGASNVITLNGSGLSAITKAGITKFGTRAGADIDNTAPTWLAGDTLAYYGRFADYTGTGSDPTLEVTYTQPYTSTVTKSLQYCVRATPATITKGLQYVVTSTVTVTVTKALQYCIRSSHAAVTKGLQYCVKITPATVTKAMAYKVNLPVTITKGLVYAINFIPRALGYIRGTATTTGAPGGTPGEIKRGKATTTNIGSGTKL